MEGDLAPVTEAEPPFVALTDAGFSETLLGVIGVYRPSAASGRFSIRR
jgi:hypothetical protein